METIHDYLAAHAIANDQGTAFTFIEDNGEQSQISFSQLHQQAQSIAQTLMTQVDVGARVVLLYPPGLEYIQAFLGCLYAGVVAVPLYPPQSKKHAGRVLTVIDDCKASLILTNSLLKGQLEMELAPLSVKGFDELIGSTDVETFNLPAPEQVAFLQYTSGSTGTPKGVVVTHANIVANLKTLQQATHCAKEDVFCNWLPLFHDLGLVNTLLLPIFLGAHSVLMSPVRFIKSPLAWFKAITEFKASICGAPNFAFDHCIERIKPHHLAGIDLSTWRIAFNAAEPVDAQTLMRFSDRFARVGFKESALFPAYGMAEATVFICGGAHKVAYTALPFNSEALQKGQAILPSDDDEKQQILIAHGQVQQHHHLKIVDPQTCKELPEGHVGEIWFAGPSLAQGYWNDPQKTAASFGATLESDDQRYLRTGDLGFMYNGELYISGRIKDVMIIKGRNYYPQDFEKLAYSAYPGLSQNGAAAFEVNGSAVLMLEISRSEMAKFDYASACETIKAAIFEHFEVVLEDILFLKAGRINRTSSGKIQRSLSKKRYLANDIEYLYSAVHPDTEGQQAQVSEKAVTVSETEAALCTLWQKTFGLDSISVEDNFLNLGGHSLLAATLVAEIQQTWRVDVSIRDLFSANTIRKLAQVIENASACELTTIQSSNQTTSLLPSYAQERMWLVNQIESNNAHYNLSFSIELFGQLNKAYLQQALNTIIERHQTLRTNFYEQSGQVLQRVRSSFELEITEYDLCALDSDEQAARIATLSEQESTKAFDLEQDLMLKVSLLKLSPQSHIMLLSVHHIAADGWSLGLLVKELNALYAAQIHGTANPLESLDIQYTDYALWQRKTLDESALQKHLQYWKVHLANLPVVHSLPLDKPRPSIQSFQGASVNKTLNKALLERLQALATEHQATTFMLMNAAFSSFLSRYSGETDIVFGSPIANREQSQVASLIGLFINNLVYRCDLSEDPTFVDLLAQTKERTLASYEHQQMPFEKLVDELQPERSLGHSPLFQVMLILQSHQMEALCLPGLDIQNPQARDNFAQYDLTLTLNESDAGLEMQWQYAVDLFEHASIERMVESFVLMLEGIVSSPMTRVSELPLLDTSGHERLVTQYNDTKRDYAKNTCIHELFEQQVSETPDAIAAIFNGDALTYQQVNQRANQLAHYFAQNGIHSGSIIGVCVERSLDMLISTLAIMKAGCAYLPLDPSYPHARLSYMLEDSEVKWVITHQHLSERLSVENLLCLDDEATAKEIARQAQSNLDKAQLELDSNTLAYLIYTSGSTGKPKGVMLEHGNVVNFLRAMQEAPGMTHDDTLLAVTSLSFDIHVLELYLPLSVGGRLVLASSDNAISADELAQLMAEHQVTMMQATPATWKMLVGNGWQPKHQLKVLCGGEALSESLKNSLLSFDNIELWNMYGPTETAVWSATCKIEDAISLGKPIANTQFYVLDTHSNPVPVGVAGELYIGGHGVARGYFNQPQLSAERFIDNPYGPGHLYKTGDLVRWLADGTLQYLRRVDHQVKVRGYRIELGEIESALLQHPQVQDAVAHVFAERDDTSLVAYVTLTSNHLQEDIQDALLEHLEALLPSYMLPNAIVCLRQIPLTPNGKVNRHALPKPERGNEAQYVAPETETEKQLCELWQQLLGIEPKQGKWLSVNSNFFNLGGHSLLAARLVALIRTQWHVEVPIRTLFTEQTVRKLAHVIDLASVSHSTKIQPAVSNEPTPLSFAQQRLWLIEQIESGTTQYNMCQAFKLSGPLDVAAMQNAFNIIVERHQVLRTTLHTTDSGTAIQVVSDTWSLELPTYDLSDLSEPEQEQTVRDNIALESSTLFNLSRDLMVRVKLLKLAPQSHVLLVTMHHIAVDGWSVGIIFDEFNRLYKDPESKLANIDIQYGDYAHWQQQTLQGERLESHLAFWKERLAGLPEVHNLALDRARPPVQDYKGAHLIQTLSPDIQTGLNELAKASNTTLFMVLHAALAILLARHSDKDDSSTGADNIVIGAPVANREQSELAPLVGFFTNSVVLQLNLSGNPSFTDLLQSSKADLLDVYEHTELPFEKLVDELQQARNLGYSPLFQVKLALQNNTQGWFDLPSITAQKIEQPHSVALHDLSLDIYEQAGGLMLDWEYATALFNASTIERMSSHFEILLKGIIAAPQSRVSELPFLSTDEVEQLLDWSTWSSENHEETSISDGQSVLDLFEAQVKEHPNNIAATFGLSAHMREAISYQQLNAKANQIAHYLVCEGVTPDTLVGLCVERSLEMVIGIWGILKAGAAYVPIDPDYPEKHIEHILEDSDIEIMLTSAELLSELPFGDLQILPLDDEMWDSFLGDYDEENLDRSKLGLTQSNLAYVIYTSGSTGQPKGVTIEHGALANSTVGRFKAYQESPQSFALFSSYAFDSSIVGIFWTHISGGKLCIVDIKQGLDLQAFETLMADEQVSHFLTLPSVYQTMLLADIHPNSSLQTVIVAGEPCDLNLVKQHQCSSGWKNCRLVNEYGPTEACVWSSYFDCTEHTEGAVPIGMTAPHTELFVLDAKQQLCPVGVTGELYVGGDNLARGYLNATAMTDEKFIASPFRDGQRLYKTGDLVRCAPDQQGKPGNLEFVGRVDHQIKIRGFRIELGEIESAILTSELVSEAVVLAKSLDPAQDTKQLVAYVVASKTQQEAAAEDDFNELNLREELVAYLENSLLSHKVPSAFVFLDALPHTPNGKVDRKALEAKDVPVQLTQQYVAPSSEIERQLCEIWQKLLKLKKVGVTENFFAIGGDSILAIQAVTQAAKQGLVLTTRQIFECQAIEKLAPLVNGTAQIEAPQEAICGEQVFIPIQREFLTGDSVDQHHYNQSVLLTVPADFTIEALRDIMFAVYQRHDILRLSVVEQAGKYMPLTEQCVERAIKCVDLGHLAGQSWEDELTKASREAKAGLSLVTADVFRAVLFTGNSTQRRLLLTAHHMVIDGVSWRILFEDMASAFEQWQQNDAIVLGAKTSSFQQWGQFLYDYANSDDISAEKAFWEAQAATPVDDLPVDQGAVEDNSLSNSDTVEFELSDSHTQALLNQCTAAYRTQINDLLLSALYLALHKWTGNHAFRVDLESHGRESLNEALDLTQTMGWFTCVYPVLLHTQPDASIEQVIKAVKEQLRAVPHGGIGFGVMQQMLASNEHRERFARTVGGASAVLFNYLGQFDQVINNDGVFQAANEFTGEDVSMRRQRGHQLELNGLVSGGKLQFSLRFNALQYQQATIKALVHKIETALIEIIEHCQSQAVGGVTPSDFALSRVDQAQLDEWYQNYPNMEKLYVTTGMQQGLLFHSSLDASAYLTQLSIDIDGALNAAAMQHAWREIIRRHDVFRTAFTDDLTHQVVLSDVNVPFTHLDWSALSDSEQQQQLSQFLQDDRAQGFDLRAVPLTRVTLVTLQARRHYLIWSNHHALSDGWSLPLVLKELLSIYTQIHDLDAQQLSTQSVVSSLPDAPQYERYIGWLAQQDKQQAQDFWREKLAQVASSTHLYLEQAKEHSTHGAAKEKLALSAQVSAQLQSLAQQHKVTLNTLIQAAWAYVVHRYSGEQRVMFGETVSGRPPELAGVNDIIGLFINSLPVVVDIQPEQDIGNWLRSLNQASVERVEHGHLPLSEIQTLSPHISSGLAERKLFDTLVVFENYPVDQEIHHIVEGSGLTVNELRNEEQTNYALTLMVLPEHTGSEDKLSFELGYRSEQYSTESVGELLALFELTLTRFLASDCHTVGQLSALIPSQSRQLLDWNNTVSEYPKESCIHELFEEHAANTPQAIAVTFDGDTTATLTYGELNAKANQLAHYLIAQGVKPDTLVGISVERSLEMVIGLLGILKAGGAYVPLDPSLPEARLNYMVQDSGAELVLTQQKFAGLFQCDQQQLVCLEQAETFAQYSTENIDKTRLGLTSSHLAYVIYTSGSTGQPKGVESIHRGMMNRLDWMHCEYRLQTGDRVLQKTPYSFDVSVWEFFWTLGYGAQLVVAKPDGHKDPEYLRDLIQTQQVTVMHFVPSMLANMLNEVSFSQLPSVRYVFCSGEALAKKLADEFNATKSEHTQLFNLYGPTEASIDVTYWECDGSDKLSFVPIGRAINNTQLYVLDTQLQPVPVGVPGVLYIGGDNLARGYLNRPELTAERFIANPFFAANSVNSSERLYHTGDLARYLPDGNLEFIGREDDQIKVRGLRIELGEIEAQLAKQSGVESAYVMARDFAGSTQLVGYIKAPNELPQAAQLSLVTQVKAGLAKQLPDYMIPSVLLVVSQWPLTPNGKVNKKALPTPENIDRQSEYIAPETQTEQVLAEMWSQLLGVEQSKIGTTTNFFELGGHSLMVVRLVAMIKQKFTVGLDMATALRAPNIKEVAHHIDSEILKLEFKQAGSEVEGDEVEFLI
ncbi:non-ribosomal peptide synthetase [Pseudoalteromonas sp. MMG022]|uniref:non-ribosomal peptide synthetase n=1 Tax=Pseudoalteromonas sp. MMG022 TaxID=2909978 RepID=UPI001F43FF26|nr:non-ribosomal peptide synthetase [Pseudoalteromonas sp. MMG022]MCF6437464.1 amino acid adenylation domain-containing protein [Pseudoalteromonas sp. MMG022]